jgi:hypothetical protein
VRVLTRTMKRIRDRLAGVRVQVRDRTRSARRRLFGILQRTRTASLRSAQEVRAQSKARIKQLYQRLLGITRATVREAETMTYQVARARLTDVRRLGNQLRGTLEIVRRIIVQARARGSGATRIPQSRTVSSA